MVPFLRGEHFRAEVGDIELGKEGLEVGLEEDVGVRRRDVPIVFSMGDEDRGGDVLGGFEGVELVDKDPADELCR